MENSKVKSFLDNYGVNGVYCILVGRLACSYFRSTLDCLEKYDYFDSDFCLTAKGEAMHKKLMGNIKDIPEPKEITITSWDCK